MRRALLIAAVGVSVVATATATAATKPVASGCVLTVHASKAFPGFFHFEMNGCISLSSMDVSATSAIKLSTAWAVMTNKDERGVGAILLSAGKEHVLFLPTTAPGDRLYVNMSGLKVGDLVTFKAKGASGKALATFTYRITNA